MKTNLIGVSGKIGSGKDTIGHIIQFIVAQYWFHGQVLETFKPNMSFAYSPDNYSIKKFAYKLKQIVGLLIGCTAEDLESESVKNTILPADWNRAIPYPPPTRGMKIESMTVRQLLQEVGTDGMRDIIHKEVWVNALFADYKPQNNCTQHSDGDFYTDEHGLNKVDPIYPKWIITDVRFPNEAESIRNRGGILIRTDRDYAVRGGEEDPKKQHPSETALDNYDYFNYKIDNNSTIKNLVLTIESILRKEKII